MTHEVKVVRATLNAAPEALCAALADSTQFARVPGVRRIDVLTTGATGAGSSGTVRKIHLLGGVILVEKFVDVQANRFDYLIVDSRPGFRHESGSVVFERAAGATRATWTSRYGLDIPIVGRVLERAAAPVMRLAFASVLSGLDRVATNP